MLGSAMTRPLASRLVTLEVVGDPEPLAGGIVHLSGRLLRVLQLGDLFFDLSEFNLDLILEVVNFCPRLFERIFVELLLGICQARHKLREIKLCPLLC